MLESLLPALQSASAASPASAGPFLLSLVIIFVASKTGGEIAVRLKQPAVLGELLAGVLVGGSALGLVDPTSPVLHLLAEVGVVLLLFEIGLESDLAELVHVGRKALSVAVVGMLVPFLLGYFVSEFFLPEGTPGLVNIFVGASMTATSIGISAAVLSGLGYLGKAEGKIVLGAAVVDDVLGVVLLSVVSELASGGTLDLFTILRIAGTSIGFLVAAVVVGNLAMPLFLRLVRSLQTRGDLIIASLGFAFSLAVVAEFAGSAAIIGAFAAGLVLAKTDKRHDIDEKLRPVTDVFLPVFFITVGASVDLSLLMQKEALLFATVLTFAAVVGKLVSGLAARGGGVNRLAVGAGMVPRGEVGLVFASVGVGAGVLTGATHTGVIIMVLLSTFIGPILLNRTLRKAEQVEEPVGTPETA